MLSSRPGLVFSALVVAAVGLMLAGCGRPQSVARSESVTVVATTTVVADLVRQVGATGWWLTA